MHAAAWSLHDSLYELARSRGLRSFRVTCRATDEGETHVILVLDPVDGDDRPDRWRRRGGRR